MVRVATGVLSPLIGKLSTLLRKEYARFKDVHKEIISLKEELSSMNAMLEKLAAEDDPDVQLKEWRNQIRDLSYDIEDCIDDFSNRLPREPRGDGCLYDVLRTLYELYTWWPRRQIAARIAELKTRAQHVGERRIRYGVLNPKRNGKNKRNVGAGAAAYLAAEHQLRSRQLVGMGEPVGMADAMVELGHWVTNSDKEDRGVLSIVGFGGVGKTTLAMALYRKFGDRFERRALVTVSQKFDLDSSTQYSGASWVKSCRSSSIASPS